MIKDLKNILDRLTQSYFFKNTLTLMTGTGLSALVMLLCSPILTRFYSPADFGIFALYVAIISIVGNVAAGRYDVTILLPKTDKVANSILIVCLSIIAALFVSSSLFLMLMGDYFFDIIRAPNLAPYGFIIPLTITLVGVQLTLNSYCNRYEGYRFLAQGKLLDAVTLNALAIALGMLGFGVWGLIIGLIAGRFLSVLYLLIKQKTNITQALKNFKWSDVHNAAARYIKFPKHSVAATLVGSLSANAHLFLFLAYFGDGIVGVIALATRVLLNPLSIIGTSFSQIFFKHIATQFDHKSLLQSYIKAAMGLGIIALGFVITVMIIPDHFITYIFGAEWAEVSSYTKIIIWWFAMQFVSSTISVIYVKFEKEFIRFIFQILNLVVSTLSIIYAHYLGMEIEGALAIFTFSKTVLYITLMILPIYYMKTQK